MICTNWLTKTWTTHRMLLVVIKIRIYYIFIYIYSYQSNSSCSSSFLLFIIFISIDARGWECYTPTESDFSAPSSSLFISILVLTIIHLHLHHFQCLSMLQFYIFGFAYIERWYLTNNITRELTRHLFQPFLNVYIWVRRCFQVGPWKPEECFMPFASHRSGCSVTQWFQGSLYCFPQFLQYLS